MAYLTWCILCRHEQITADLGLEEFHAAHRQSQQLRDFLRIVAPSRTSYEMRWGPVGWCAGLCQMPSIPAGYFNINDEKNEED